MGPARSAQPARVGIAHHRHLRGMNRELSLKQVFRHREAVVRVGCRPSEATARTGHHPALAHQSRDAVAADGKLLAHPQLGGDAGRAVAALVRLEGRTNPGPRIQVAAPGVLESLSPSVVGGQGDRQNSQSVGTEWLASSLWMNR